jgi:hypothetical protein
MILVSLFKWHSLNWDMKYERCNTWTCVTFLFVYFLPLEAIGNIKEWLRIHLNLSVCAWDEIVLERSYWSIQYQIKLPIHNVRRILSVVWGGETPWPESASKLYRPSDRRLSAKLLPAFVDRVCHVVSVTDPFARILDFLDWQLYENKYKVISYCYQLHFPSTWHWRESVHYNFIGRCMKTCNSQSLAPKLATTNNNNTQTHRHAMLHQGTEY